MYKILDSFYNPLYCPSSFLSRHPNFYLGLSGAVSGVLYEYRSLLSRVFIRFLIWTVGRSAAPNHTIAGHRAARPQQLFPLLFGPPYRPRRYVGETHEAFITLPTEPRISLPFESFFRRLKVRKVFPNTCLDPYLCHLESQQRRARHQGVRNASVLTHGLAALDRAGSAYACIVHLPRITNPSWPCRMHQHIQRDTNIIIIPFHIRGSCPKRYPLRQ